MQDSEVFDTVEYMNTQATKLVIDVYGFADKMICAGCEGHGCTSCSPAEKQKTIDLVNEFRSLLEKSEFASYASVNFFEATTENIARHDDVQNILSMAELDPVIVINDKLSYMGGFSPLGLLEELKKLA